MSPGLRVGLLFGGRSVEHEVSVVSARGIAAAMRRTSLECVPIAVTEAGVWLSPEVSTAILDGDAARVTAGAGGRLLADPGGGGLRHADSGEAVEIDVLFPIVHGQGGEDGRCQGLLDLAGVPYVGAGVLGSSCAMDKAVARSLFEQAGLPLLPWSLCLEADHEADPDGERSRVAAITGFPAFVKPANGGSSVGVVRAEDDASLEAALRQAFRYDDRVVVERGAEVREIECAVIGNDVPEVSGLGEIVPPEGEFYDYAAKYLDTGARLLIPAPLDEEVAERIRRMAAAAYRAVAVRGLARVDFFVGRSDGRIFLNEINTLPGFTPISMFSMLWEADGLAYPQLIERLVDLALERVAGERRRETRREAASD